ncbi:hypothetical protein IFM89_039458 [Coptis chinensis]|uniref:UBA domain-containing protein n=1 Tax=Coptis chinensis TaxID=261450 RepID=A0A835MEH7_9MAGN|nr:hypothetical protein IFM89_039458 [Coptis chinensis]
MELEQLMSMGFSQELATQALAATGGNSTIKATEWILDQKPNSPNPNSSFQPKLNRFFSPQTQRKPLSPTINTNPELKLDLFPNPKRTKVQQNPPHHEPLSERMRPRNADEIIGQDHILGKNAILRSSLDCNRLPSIVLWGPPGTGKTSIAKAIVSSSTYKFVSLSAVTAGVKDVRDVVEEAKKKINNNRQTVLFVDEVHRFNKSQQDSFLPVIEDGTIVFIGATTENPSFHLITPLLSRCRVLKLNSLEPEIIGRLLRRAVDDGEKGLRKSVGMFGVVVEDDVFDFLSLNSDGDARVALNALEIAATTAAARELSSKDKGTLVSFQTEDVTFDNSSLVPFNGLGSGENGVGSLAAVVTLDDAKEALQCKHLAYDRAGEEHYNLISALHKSLRGSDANASIYWLARMLEGGEHPLYIARRLVRFASEDVGLGDPNALCQAVACYQACHFLGMPECNVNLAQCVVYLALAPKSIAVYEALQAAQKAVKESIGQNEGVPLHLRNAPTKLMKDFDYGKGYIYPPHHPSSSLSQTYLPPSLQGCKFFDWPVTNMDK